MSEEIKNEVAPTEETTEEVVAPPAPKVETTEDEHEELTEEDIALADELDAEIKAANATKQAPNVKAKDPFDLENLEPQKVSTDISSYTTMIYGPPKAGKTTFIYELYGRDAVFMRTEKGTKLLPGLFGVDVAKWSDVMKVIKQLRKPGVKAKFKVVVIDTADNLYKYLEKYIKSKHGVDNIKEANGGWGAGHAELSETIFDALKLIEGEGYSLSFISHSKVKTETLPGTEQEFTKYIPSVPDRGLEIITKMVDTILFAYLQVDPVTRAEKRVIYTRETMNFQAGSRFTTLPAVLPMDAGAYKQAMKASIEAFGAENLKSEKEEIELQTETLDYKLLRKEASAIAVRLHKAGRMAEVTAIVEKYLGQGKLLNSTTEAQVETVSIIVDELRSL